MSCSNCECGTLESITKDTVECFSVCEPTILEIVGRGPQGIQGVPGITLLVPDADVTGAIDGVNVDFTVEAEFTGILVYLGGIRQKEGEDYTITGADTFQFLSPPLTGMILVVDYVPTI